MRDIARQAIENTAIGETGVMKPDGSDAAAVEAFQAVVHSAALLSAQGVISVTDMRSSSRTVDRPVLSILFVRLR